MSKYREMFLTEARRHLKEMARLLLALEKAPGDAEGIDALFREAHSVKGMAASMGYERTAELSHSLEELMEKLRKEGKVPPEAADRLFDGIDLLDGLVKDLAEDRPEREISDFLSGKAGPKRASRPPRKLLLKVELAEGAPAPAARALLLLREAQRLGKVLSSAPSAEEVKKGGKVERVRISLESERSAADIEKVLLAMADLNRVEVEEEGAFPPPAPPKEKGGRTVQVGTELLDRFVDLTGELVTSRTMLQALSREKRWEDLDEGLDALASQISDLHHHVLKVRMMPLESITGDLPRLVRDLCRQTGKSVELRLSGEGIELDRAIIEKLSAPLVHLIRNAVDHGIEKSGELSVRARREKDLLLLEVADDGRGLDSAAIRRKAVARNIVSPEAAERLEGQDLWRLICSPGFSTASAVTELSGRGVGMDIVKSAAESLGGTLEISSEAGRGTSFLLKVPLSVAIIRILLVECRGRRLAFPITKVVRALAVSRRDIETSGRRLVMRLEEESVPLISLSKILRLPAAPLPASVPTVIVEMQGRKVGLVVDRLVGHREVFIRALDFPLKGQPGLGGATILGDGSIVFIVDPSSLLEAFAGGRP